jgi:hypothetical protein
MITSTLPTLHGLRGRVVGAVAVVALAGFGAGPLASGASAATSVPTIDPSSLEAALDSIPGITASQSQALVSDLEALENGATPADLDADLDPILTALGNAAGEPGLVSDIAGALDNLLGDNGTQGQIPKLISDLENLSGTSGIAPAVGQALAQLAEALTTADLPGILGQAGSPLSSQLVQGVLGDLATLESLPSGATVPAGTLDDVGQALDTIAAQPGVPAAAGDALETAAGTLESADGIVPAALDSTLPPLESSVPALDSVPGAGPVLGSLTGAVTTEMAGSPPATSSGGSGAGTSSTTYVSYLQTPPANAQTKGAAASASMGASIRRVAFKKNRLHVVLSCPAALKSGCKTAIYLRMGSWKAKVKTVTFKAGKSRTVALALPHLATVAAKHSRIALSVTATTGTHTTNAHTLHIRIKR